MDKYIVKSSLSDSTDFEIRIKKKLLKKSTNYANSKSAFLDSDIIMLPFESDQIKIFFKRLIKNVPIFFIATDDIYTFVNYCCISDYLGFKHDEKYIKKIKEVTQYFLWKEISQEEFIYLIENLSSIPSESEHNLKPLIDIFFQIYKITRSFGIITSDFINKLSRHTNNLIAKNIISKFLNCTNIDTSDKLIWEINDNNDNNDNNQNNGNEYIVDILSNRHISHIIFCDDDLFGNFIDSLYSFDNSSAIKYIEPNYKKMDYSCYIIGLIDNFWSRDFSTNIGKINKIKNINILENYVNYFQLRKFLHLFNMPIGMNCKLDFSKIKADDHIIYDNLKNEEYKKYTINKKDIIDNDIFLFFVIEDNDCRSHLLMPVKISHNSKNDTIEINTIHIACDSDKCRIYSKSPNVIFRDSDGIQIESTYDLSKHMYVINQDNFTFNLINDGSDLW